MTTTTTTTTMFSEEREDEEAKVFKTAEEQKALTEMKELHKNLFQTVSPTEIKLAKLLDSCKFTMDKYMNSHSELVMLYTKLNFFYRRFNDLNDVHMDFIESLTDLTKKGFIDEDQMDKYVETQKQIMQDLSKYKKSLAEEYGITLSDAGIEEMRREMKEFFQKVHENIKSIERLKEEYAKGEMSNIPKSGVVKLDGKLYSYITDKDNQMTSEELK